jgi:hypothetical protein
MEIWEAKSADGQWTYQRVEDTGTPWDVCHLPTGREEHGFTSLLAARHWTAEQTATHRATVLDCPDCAWAAFGTISTDLDGRFVNEYRALLDEAARELLRRPLIEAWRRHGYRVRLLDRAECQATPASRKDPPHKVWDVVRQEAADAVTADAVVHEAWLVDELAAFPEVAA